MNTEHRPENVPDGVFLFFGDVEETYTEDFSEVELSGQ